MSYYYRWATPFNIDINTLNSWEKNLPPSHTLLQWALLQNKIQVPKYLEWASETYQISVLNSSFFTNKFNEDFWKKIEESYSWSSTFIPLMEWDGVIFVGCLEPPDKKIEELNLHYFLCNPTDLSTRWEDILSLEETQRRRDEEQFLEEKKNLNQNERPANSMEISLDFSQITPNPTASNEELKSEHPQEPILENIETKTEQDAKQTHEPSTATNIPDITLDFTNITEEEPNQSEEIDSDNSITAPIIITEDTTSDNALTSKLSLSPPALSPQVLPPPPSIDEQVADNPIITNSSVEGGAITLSSSAPTTTMEVKSVNDLAQYVFSQTTNSHEKQILFIKKDENYFPIRWSNDLSPKEGAQTALNTDSPNIFRIPYQTQKPFHGHISSNSINDTFLNNWNISAESEVTIQPIINNQNDVLALFFATAKNKNDSLINTNFVLKEIETLCEKVTPIIEQIDNLSAA